MHYMKRIEFAIITALAIMLVPAGCTKDNYKESKGTAVLGIRSVTTDRVSGKSVITDATLPSTEAAKGVGLFLTAADGSSYDGRTEGYTNVKYSNAGEGWTSDTPVILSETRGILYGYFPYDESNTDMTSIGVRSSLDGTDYMYANPVDEVSVAAPYADLTMHHALARLSIKFVRDAGYVGTGKVTSLSVSGDCIAETGKLNAKTGAVTPSGVGSVSFALSDTVSMSGLTKELLLVPTAESDRSLTIRCTIDDKEFSAVFDGADTLCIRSGRNSVATLSL